LARIGFCLLPFPVNLSDHLPSRLSMCLTDSSPYIHRPWGWKQYVPVKDCYPSRRLRCNIATLHRNWKTTVRSKNPVAHRVASWTVMLPLLFYVWLRVSGFYMNTGWKEIRAKPLHTQCESALKEKSWKYYTACPETFSFRHTRRRQMG
jgi:hypothetical protein